MMKAKMRKVLAIICMMAVFVSSFPTWVFAQNAEFQNELREAIEGGEEMKALFPNGAFTFIGTRFNISENKGTYEIQIARQGGTQGEVTVNFKAIDVSAKYGSDYVIEVPGFLWNEVIPENPDSRPLLEDAIKEENELVNSDDLGIVAEVSTSDQKDEVEKVLEDNTDEEIEPVVEEQQREVQSEQTSEGPGQQMSQPEQTEEEQQQEYQPGQTEEEPQQEAQPEQINKPEQQEDQPEQTAEEPRAEENQPELTEEELEDLNKSKASTEATQGTVSRAGRLRDAAKMLTGKTYNAPNWKELDIRPTEAEALRESYEEYFDQIPGMETTLTFKDGEYLKSIYIRTIDDDLPESEEQFIIVLSNPTGGAELGEFYNGWVNIIDNEEFEVSSFEMELDKLIVEAGIPQVSVKVRRTKGIHTLTYVTVGTSGSTAEPNVDYIPASKRLLFLPEATEQTFTVDLITTYTDADKKFAIVIDDTRAAFGKEKTVITLAKAPGSYPLYENKSAKQSSTAKNTMLALEYSVNSQSSALEKITPNGKMEAAGRYMVMPNDFTLRYGNNASKPVNSGAYGISMNPYNGYSSAGVQAQLSLAGVKELNFVWSNSGAGRSYVEHHDFLWWCTSKCKTKYEYDFDSKFALNGLAASPWNKWPNNQYIVKQIHGTFGSTAQSLTIQPWMWSLSNIEFWAWNGKNNTANILSANAVYLTLQEYKLKIENTQDTGVTARTITGINSSGELVGTDGTPVNVGSIKIRNVSRDGNHSTNIENPHEKSVYRSDVITFETVFNNDPETGKSYADDVYFWGYKVRDRQGNWKYFEGNVMNLNSQWFRENAAVHQNETGGLFANALLRDDGKGNWFIEVRPVFKTKNETFIKLDIDSSKGNIDGFLNNTNSRVFAISRFDTLRLNVVTKGSATVYDWYVINDNSNIKVNSLADATTYFNNLNVGSSGNLPTTSSFLANANKVTLDSSNVNPAVKTQLTYKPTARFTNIMPSFAVNAITVQENPSNPTKYEPYDIKIISEGVDIRSRFLNDDESRSFFESERVARKAYTFQYKIRPTGNDTVPTTVYFNLYKDTDLVKAQPVETITLTRDSSGVYSFTLNYWDDKYYGSYATMTINGIEQPVDFMHKSGAFVTLHDERYNTITAGNAFNPIVYEQVTRNDVYTITGYSESNFTIEWMNATGDLDKDGVISPFEDSLFKEYRMIDRTKTVGDSYYLKASYDMPTVYYNFVNIDPNRDTRVISGNISLADKTYFNQNAVTTTPLKGVEITVAGIQTTTDKDGNFQITSNKFEAGKSYSCVYTYQGYKYTGVMMVGQNNIIIDLFKDPDIELINMKVYKIPEEGGDEMKPVSGYISLYDEDKVYDYEFDLSAGRLAATTVEAATIVVRDKDGNLRNDNKTIFKEEGTSGRFITQINPDGLELSMSVGDSIYIRPMDNNGTSYPEIAIGIRIVQDPSKIRIHFGVNDEGQVPTVPLFGSMMAKFDLMDTTADKAKPMTDEDKANLESLKGSGNTKLLKSAAADDETIDETIIDDMERNLFTIAFGFDSDILKELTDHEEEAKGAVNGEAPEFSFGVSFIFVFEIGADGKAYFNQLGLTAELNWGAGVTFMYVTPIGIPVYCTLSFSIGGSFFVGAVVKDEDRNPPMSDWSDDQWKDEDILAVEVEITISIGVGVELGIGVSLMKIYLTGSAEVDFTFTFVDLSASVSFSLEAAVGFRFLVFTKEFTIVSRTWGKTTKRAMRATGSGLYEEFSGFDELTREYLSNRGGWTGGTQQRRFKSFMAAAGRGSIEERFVLEDGAYPYPSNKLVNLPNGKMLWVFLDDDVKRSGRNRTAVYYSIVDENGDASYPVMIEEDGTLDEAPDVIDLGNGEILITWSDASRTFDENDKEVDVLSNMDITAAFFDVENEEITSVTEITKTTKRTGTNRFGSTVTVGDYYGDTSPRAAYDPDTETILLYYIKTDYFDGIGGEIPDGSIDDETGSEISNEDAKLLVGDIVNGFSLITYRLARKVSGNWVWDTSYPDEEKITKSIEDSVKDGSVPADYTAEDYINDWYGQGFLDLGLKAEVKEVWTTEENDTDRTQNGYNYSEPGKVKVEHKVTPSPSEPRALDTAVISYNGLALFAYTADANWDLMDDEDQDLYLQIYNFSENSFSHPIKLTVDDVEIDGVKRNEYLVKDSQPKFVRSNGITYLFWNRNGSIAYMDISGLVKYGLKLEPVGSGYVYVIDKNNDNFDSAGNNLGIGSRSVQASTGKWGEIMLAVDKNINPRPEEGNEATEDSAITSYDVVTSDDGDVYLVWTEYKTVFKDNNDHSPENQEREKQVFVARWQPETMIERVQVDYMNEWEDDAADVNGTTYQYIYDTVGHYPATILVNGVSEPIDYTQVADVNGFVGAAKAGDPIIKQNYVPTGKPGWSKPIQITTEPGANYDELGVAALEGNAGVKIAFIKYIQTLEETNDGKKQFKHNLTNRKLGFLTYWPTSGVEFNDNSLAFSKERPKVGDQVVVSATVKNTGIEAIRDARVEFYQVVDGVETLIDTVFKDTYQAAFQDDEYSSEDDVTAVEVLKSAIVGGDEFTAQLRFEIPENEGNVSIKAVLKFDGSAQGIAVQKSFTFEAVPEISDLRYEFTGIGKVVLDGTITNNGNKDDTMNIEISLVDRYGIENTIAYVPVTLKQGESSYFAKEIEISDSYFTEIPPQAGSATDAIKEMTLIKVGSGAIKDQIAVVRSAPSRALEVMNEVSGFSVRQNNISVRKGTTGKIEYNIAYNGAATGEKTALRDELIVRYTTSNPNVVQVASDGTLYALSDGTATVQTVLMPATTNSVATKGTPGTDRLAPMAHQLSSFAALPSSVLRIENVSVTVYTGSAPSGGGSSGGGSSGNGSNVVVTPTVPDSPDSPVQAEIRVPATVDSNNNATVSVTAQMINDAINKAQAEAEKNGHEQNDIALVLKIDTGNETTGTITVNLPKAVQETIIEKGIVSTIIVVDNLDIVINMDLETVKEINRQANGDANITATRADNSGLPAEAGNAVGSRPVFDINVNYGSGSQVQNFGDGSVWVTIPYTLRENEKAENICAVYIDQNGNVYWLSNSVYDSDEKVLRFRTNHFSLYGVGYNDTASKFTDIAGHWAKSDIEFMASRGLFAGTSKTTFSPNMAMSRGMFVTVLGRLAGVDVSKYKKSSFTDVNNNSYYVDYIEWAKDNNIALGTGNGEFSPDEPITREQMATMLLNYTKAMDIILPKVQEEKTFADSAKISGYAREALKQMQMAGLMVGNNNLVEPQGTATRAAGAAVIRRFIELMFDR